MSKIKYFTISSVLCFVMLIACQKIDHYNELPTIITGDTSSAQSSSVIITGLVTPNDAPIKTSGHVWSSINQLPGYSDNEGRTFVTGILPQNKIISSLTNLLPGKTYYIRGYVVSGIDTVYGNIISYITAANKPASVTTGAVSKITLTSADVAATVISTGTTPVTQHGIVWSNTNQNPTTTDSVSSLGPLVAPASYTSSLTNLSPATAYYARAYVTNNAGTVYGNVVNFTTLSNIAPSVTTDSIVSVSINSATARGTIISIGSSGVTQYGHVWSSVNNVPTINDSKSQLGTANAPIIFGSQLTGLSANTKYYIRSYAINVTGIAYGAVLTFTTGAVANNPAVVTTGNTSAITTNTATVAGSITNIGSSAVTQYGHVWSSVNNVPTINDSKSQLGTANAATNFNSQLAGLTPTTTYYVRAYATNSGGTAYGAVITFTTGSQANLLPTVTTDSVVQDSYYNINPLNSADLYGTIKDTGSSNITHWGHVWSSTNTTPTINDSKSDISTYFTSFLPYKYGSSPRNVLIPATKYYVRSYAINNSGISYGNTISFTTASYTLATLSAGPAFNITFSEAEIPGEIVTYGNSTVTAYGHCISATNPNPTTADLKTSFGNTVYVNAFNYSSIFSNLIAGTTYYVRAYAINSAGTAYSSVTTFVTTPHTPPIINTGTISNITFTSAIAGGQIASTGNDPLVTQYGHVWSSTNNVPTINDNKTQLGSASTGVNFTSSLTGLTAGTTYYVRAYGINSGGIAYGQVISFSTSSASNIYPSVTTGNISSITFSTANAAGNITDIGSSPVTNYGHVWSSTNTVPTIADSKTDLGIASAPRSFNSSLTGLQTNIAYYVRAYAINSTGITYGATQLFYTAKNDPANINFQVPPDNVTATTATFSGNIYDIGSSPVTQYGLVWSSSNNLPTINDSKTQLGAASAPLSFMSTLTGLTPSTGYYMRAYAVNAAGIYYTSVYAFYTAAFYAPPSISTGAVSNTSFTSATAAGAITNTNNSSITDYGHVWSSTNNVPTTNDNKTQFGSSSSAVSYSSSITGLTPGTIYYVRAYAINLGGISYGNVVSFTATAYVPAAVTTGDPYYQPPGVASGFVDFPGTITSTGNTPVTQHGHVWSNTNTTPTLADNFNQLGAASTGTYNSAFSPNVITRGTYYVRAYATNSAGTSYGAVKIFTY